MGTKPAALRVRLEALEHELQRDLRRAERQLKQSIPSFLRQSRPLNVLSAPVIYSMVFPIALLDAWVTIYQWICFPLFGIGCSASTLSRAASSS